MKYQQLLSISLKHNYFNNGLCPDFAVVPQKSTETLLKNHRCVVKPKVNGINIYIPTDEANIPVIPFTHSNQLLSFDLHLKNPEFALYTDFSQLPSNHNFQRPIVDNNLWLSADRTRFFLIPSKKKPDTGNFYIKTLTGQESLVDFSSIKANEINEIQASQWINAFNAGVFATIHIQQNFNQIDAISSIIYFAFAAKQTRWVYYLVTNQGSNDNDFSITFGSQNSPSFTWKRMAITESDKIAKLLEKDYPQMKRLCFISEQNITCRESGLKNIQLSLGQNKIFENLPAPPIRNYYQVTLDNTPQQADAIYTVVKSITNTTLTKV